MALHPVKKSDDPASEEDVYASSDLSQSAPKYRMPDGELEPRDAFSLVSDELMVEGNSRLNLATFCQTWLEPEITLLMARTYDKNMIDKDEYPQTAELERRCVAILAGLSTNPPGAEVTSQQLTAAVHATRGIVDGYWLNIPGRGSRCPTCNSPRPDVGRAALRAVL